MLAFVVSFLQRLIKSESATLMSLQNLALVFAPSIFRVPEHELNISTSNGVPTPFVNAGYERAFMIHLLQAIDPAVDLGYVGSLPAPMLVPDFADEIATTHMPGPLPV